jgi:hypothetical protein
VESPAASAPPPPSSPPPPESTPGDALDPELEEHAAAPRNAQSQRPREETASADVESLMNQRYHAA